MNLTQDQQRFLIAAAIAAAVPLAWGIVVGVVAPESLMTRWAVLGFLVAVVGGVLVAILWLDSRNQTPQAPALLKQATWWAALVMPALLFLVAWMSTWTWFAGSQRVEAAAVAAPPAPPELSQREQDAVWSEYRSEPLAHGWQFSPDHLEPVFDRAQMSGQYLILNPTYLNRLHMEVKGGRTSVSVLKWEAYPVTDEDWVRSSVTHDFDDAEPVAILISSTQGWLDKGRKEIQLRLEAKRTRDKALVIRTERLVREGETVMWGRVPTRLDQKPLTTELKLVFLKADGSPYPLSTRFPVSPELYLGDYGVHCVHPVHTIRIDPEVSPGTRIGVRIPPQFGDSYVLLNWKIE